MTVITPSKESFYKAHIFCCVNERSPGHIRGSCANKKSMQFRAYLKARIKAAGITGIRVNAAGCLDRCELGPVLVIYPDNVWYTYRSNEDLDEIVRTHIIDGELVERLILRPKQTKLDYDRHWKQDINN